MQQIGLRELRRNASLYLRQVKAGASFEVTDHGKPIALLVPRTQNRWDELIARGELRPAKGDLADREPLPAEPGKPTLSSILEQLRADER